MSQQEYTIQHQDGEPIVLTEKEYAIYEWALLSRGHEKKGSIIILAIVLIAVLVTLFFRPFEEWHSSDIFVIVYAGIAILFIRQKYYYHTLIRKLAPRNYMSYLKDQ